MPLAISHPRTPTTGPIFCILDHSSVLYMIYCIMMASFLYTRFIYSIYTQPHRRDDVIIMLYIYIYIFFFFFLMQQIHFLVKHIYGLISCKRKFPIPFIYFIIYDQTRFTSDSTSDQIMAVLTLFVFVVFLCRVNGQCPPSSGKKTLMCVCIIIISAVALIRGLMFKNTAACICAQKAF